MRVAARRAAARLNSLMLSRNVRIGSRADSLFQFPAMSALVLSGRSTGRKSGNRTVR